jgi:dienelactone hydrolase
VRLLILVVALIAGCAPALEAVPFPAADAKNAPDPSKLGPYPVGVRTLTFVDDSRPDPHGGSGKRTLTTEIWYPADESARGKPGASYVLYDILPADIQAKLATKDLGELKTTAVRDAPARPDEKFPVVLFSHGKGGIRMQSTYYTVFLASHGYVVVAPDHPGDTIVDLLEAGNVDVVGTVQNYVDRPRDIEFLADELTSLSTKDPLQPLLDMEHLAVTGHSFGALTTMIVAGQDYRFQIGVAQSPVGVGLVDAATDQPLDDFGKPLMIQSGGKDKTLPEDVDAASLWDHMKPPRAWESLLRAGHFTYSDLCTFDVKPIGDALSLDVENVLNDGCGPTNTPPDIAFPLIRTGAIGFMNVHLRGSATSSKFLTQGALDALFAGESTMEE